MVGHGTVVAIILELKMKGVLLHAKLPFKLFFCLNSQFDFVPLFCQVYRATCAFYKKGK